MHFAYPTRRAPDPPIFSSSRQRPSSNRRRARLRRLAAIGGAVLLFLVLLYRNLHWAKDAGEWKPKGTPPVVIVTVVEPGVLSDEYLASVRENRRRYAERHGYKTFFAEPEDYDVVADSPHSWARIAAVRHALTLFPECGHVWLLDQDAFIMDPSLSLDARLLSPSVIERFMIVDYPVVPPDSIIRTRADLAGGGVDLVVSQDRDGLASGSIVVRNGEWARFFLDTWIDPLYRSYNFEKAEAHALEHIVQWHPTILARLALVPQRALSAYGNGAPGEQYKDGDFVVRFPECVNPGPGQGRCEEVAARFMTRWRTAFRAVGA